MHFFLEQKKRVKPCVVRSSFSVVLLQQKKKGTANNPSFFSVKERQPYNLFFRYIFSRKVFLLIRFRRQFSGEIFINLS